MISKQDATAASAEQRPNGTSRIYAVVLGIGVMCSLAIVMTFEITRPIIRRNKIAQRRQAILDVVPEANEIVVFGYDEKAGKFYQETEDTESTELVFAGFDDAGALVGLVMPAEGMGYQDTIRLLYGYDPQQEAVIGIRVLESRETPGLGDRIEKDATYLKNFERLDVRLGADGESLSHEITFVKPGEKSEAWQVDGITGATISSRAVADILRTSTNKWVPRIHSRLNELQLSSSGGASS